MKIMQTMAGGPIGGAEEFFVRLASAFQARGVEQTVVIRPNHTRDAQLRGSGVNPIELPFGRILDFRTVSSLAEELDRVKPDVVLSWMNRASEMTGRARLRARSKSIQIGRQGGYYDLKYYRNCDHLIGNTPDIVQYIIASNAIALLMRHEHFTCLASTAFKGHINLARFVIRRYRSASRQTLRQR